MKSGKQEVARANWRKLIEEQARSGQSVAAFRRARGMWPSSFFLWTRKLAAKVASAGFVEAKLAARPPASGVVVELGARRRLRVQRGFTFTIGISG